MKKNILFIFLVFFSQIFSLGVKNNDIEIIELDEHDWKLYRDIRLQAVKEFPQSFKITYEEELQVNEADWKRRLKFNMLFAKKGKNIIGMIGAIIEPYQKINHIASLTSFYVGPDERNKGIGYLLLDHIINRLKRLGSIKKIILTVTTDHIKAINLYKKLGFYINGLLKNEYKIENKFYDQYMMTKHIIEKK